ncbi:MAG: hypothetical protein HY329_00355, partial [Chloroflexi bacterium]|nr:hypothetical protein [Chloroflexota bacterium]
MSLPTLGRRPASRIVAFLGALAVLLSLIPPAEPVYAMTYDVQTTKDAVQSNGVARGACVTDLPGRLCTLRAALTAADQLDGGPHRINVPAGTYILDAAGPTNAGAFFLSDVEIALVGAGEATTIVEGGGRFFTFSNCGTGCANRVKLAISGMAFQNFSGEYSPVLQNAYPSTMELTNVTVTNNKTVAIGNSGAMTLTNVTVTNNTFGGNNTSVVSNSGSLAATGLRVIGNVGATGSGGAGGIDSRDGRLTLTNTQVLSNTTNGGGAGGVQTIFGTAMLTNVLISGNAAHSSGGGGGLGFAAGGLDVLGATVTLSNTVISHNRITGPVVRDTVGGLRISGSDPFTMNGGAVQGNSGSIGGIGLLGSSATTITVSGATIANNTGGTLGGGLFIQSGMNVTLTDSTIAANSTANEQAAGGASVFCCAALTMERVTVSGNTGGGIAHRAGRLQLTNLTVSGNGGDGVVASPGFGSSEQLTNVTIANQTSGVGLNIVTDATPALELKNTLLANNANGNCTVPVTRSVSSQGGNLSSDGSCASVLPAGNDFNLTDPLLGPLADNGGPTQTHALQPGSPAIDGGVDDGCPAIDQRRAPRPQGARCDIGAFEVGSAAPVPPGGAPSGSSVVYVPTVRNVVPDAVFGGTWRTGLQVLNLSGSKAASVQIRYVRPDGTQAAVVSPVTIAAGKSQTFFGGTIGVDEGFNGAAVVSADGPIAVIANELSQDTGLSASFNGVAQTGRRVSVPIALRGRSGFNTALYVQNAGTAAATRVEVKYFKLDASSPTASQVITTPLAPGASLELSQAALTELGDDFQGSAIVEADQPLAVVVNQSNGRSLLAGTGQAQGAASLSGPLVMNNNGGFGSLLQVQNAGTASTQVTVRVFSSATGAKVGEQTRTLAAGAATAWPIAAPLLPNDERFVGSVTVEAAGGQLIGVVNQANPGSNQASAYSLFAGG